MLGPLVAQNRSYVRYEVRVNRGEFDFIRDNKLYLRANFPSDTAAPLRFPENSIEVKAAWRVVKPDELTAARGRYYITRAMMLDPVADACSETDVALVGFHIVQKTSRRPQWIWSSFEHIDNAPEFGVSNPSGAFSFNNTAKPQKLDPPKSPPPISAMNLPKTDPEPAQVIRQKSIHKSTKQTNLDYHTKLAGTVWTNYVLVLTQWPTAPSPEDSIGAPFPAEGGKSTLANMTMETYFQTNSPPNTREVGCMKCHDLARKQKTDFVWFLHLRAFGPVTPQTEGAINSLRTLLE